MFKNAVNNKLKIKPIIYENTNYWRLYNSLDNNGIQAGKLLNVVIQILNADLLLSNKIFNHKYTTNGYFDISKMGRILQLIQNGGTFEEILKILYQIFKIKFIIINMSVPIPGSDANLTIDGCDNPPADTDPVFEPGSK